MTKVAESSESGDAVSGSMGVSWCQRRTLAKVNGCGDCPVMVYSPGWSKKKNANQIRSAAPRERAVFCRRAMAAARWRTCTGIGRTRDGAESSFRKPLRMRVSRGWSAVDPGTRQGSCWLTIVCAMPT
jgi:hypothetical protein